jgi:hypothetical protein
MKHILHITGAALCLVVLWLTGCTDLLKPPAAPRNGGGIVEVRIGTPEGRTLYPVLDEFTKYALSFDGPAAHENEVITGGSADIELTLGQWTIIATAYTGTGAEEKAAARGSATVTVSETESVPANITLGPITGGEEKGTFSYTITLPEGASAATLTLTNTETDPVVPGQPITLQAGETKGSLECDPGYYLMQVRFTHATGESAGLTEVVHIYPSLTTSAEFDLSRPFVAVTSIDFAQTEIIAGNDFSLAATVRPSYATNKTIVWSVTGAGETGATIDMGVLKTTKGGTVMVMASIADGTAVGTAYTQNYEITVLPSEQLSTGNPHLDMLKELGITAVAQRLDPNGNALPADYTPMGKKPVFGRLNEIFIADWRYPDQGGKNITFLEDFKGGSSASALSYNTKTYTYKKVVAGNFEGDSREEVMVVYYDKDTKRIIPTIYRSDGTTSAKTAVTYNGSVDIDGIIPTVEMSAAAGDMDGDGLDDLMVGFFDRIYIWNGNSQSSSTLNVSCRYPQIALADYDQDGLMEWILVDGGTTGAKFTVYDDLTNGGGTRNIAGGTLSNYLPLARVATGDFDGDGLPDTAFYDKQVLQVLRTSMDRSSRPVFALDEIHTTGPNLYAANYADPFAAGDINGDGKADIIAGGTLYYNNFADMIGDTSSSSTFYFMKTAAIGDVDGDMIGDLVCLMFTSDMTSISKLEIFTFNPGGTLTSKYALPLPIAQEDQEHPGLWTTFNDAMICLPNVDNDSFELEYIEQELLFTSPIVEAVIASPPYWEDANNGAGGTTYGKSSSSGETNTHSGGFSVGVSLGWGTPAATALLGFKVDYKATVTNSFNWAAAKTTETTETWAHSIGLGEDKVVYTAVPFDVYYYKVLKAPTNNGAGQGGENLNVGDTLVVSIPRRAGTYNTEREFYNAHNGDAPDITVEHTIGDPRTYLTRSAMAAKKNQVGDRGLFTTIRSVNAGISNTGSTSQSVETVTAEEVDLGYELELGIEAEFEVGAVKAGVNASFSYGYNHTAITSEGLFIEGEVPDIPTATPNAQSKVFTWGLLMYPMEKPGLAYNFVTYWTETQ